MLITGIMYKKCGSKNLNNDLCNLMINDSHHVVLMFGHFGAGVALEHSFSMISLMLNAFFSLSLLFVPNPKPPEYV